MVRVKSDELPKAVEDAIAAGQVAEVSNKDFNKLKEKVRAARVLQKRIETGEALLKELGKQENEILMNELPDLMNTMRVPSITIDAEGNEPAFTATNKPFYSASLARPKKADQPDPRPEGFEYLISIGHGDLIKQEVSFLFPVGTDPKLIHDFVQKAIKLKVESKRKPVKRLRIPFPSVDTSVHAGTLTAWLRRQVEQEKFVPNLTKIGGFLGRKVEIKTVEE
jgi:hypothetical protein